MSDQKIHWASRCLSTIAHINPYQPGRSGRFFEKDRDFIKLSSNENLLGCSPHVRDAISNFSTPHFYPDASDALCSKIAAYHGVETSQVTLGNGSNDVLELITRCFVSVPSSQIMASEYGFVVYKLATYGAGGEFIQVPADNSFGADLQRMLEAITPHTKIIFLANPNNPTGTWHRKSDLRLFLEKVPNNVVVVIDQAYFEYACAHPSYPNAVCYMREFDNLIVTGSFSKAFGLAGLRVGYGISNHEIAGILNKIRQPFNVNAIALFAACCALDDMAFVTQSRALVTAGLSFLTQGLTHLGIQYIDSIANFITIKANDAERLFTLFLEDGLIVRPLGAYEMSQHLRITIGLPEHQKKVLATLGRYV